MPRFVFPQIIPEFLVFRQSLATSENGRVKLATDPLPSQQIAEEQLNKFYQREPEETQAEQIQLRTSEDDGKEE